MAEIKFEYSEKQYELLMNRNVEIKNSLSKILFENTDDKDSVNKLKDTLLSYHMEDGGFIEIVDLKIADAEIDPATGNGKIVFEYVLGYSNTCAGTRTDLTKKDSGNFKIDMLQRSMILSLMDMETPLPNNEF